MRRLVSTLFFGIEKSDDQLYKVSTIRRILFFPPFLISGIPLLIATLKKFWRKGGGFAKQRDKKKALII